MIFSLSRASSLLFLSSAAAQAPNRKYDGPDYESLPLKTIFPGPWEDGIRAPVNKSHIVPTKIFNFEGAVSGVESALQNADTGSGQSWVISVGGLVTFEFAENIAGR